MKILLLILMPFFLFAQQSDWSNATTNYPTTFDDTTSIWHADSSDYVPGTFYNKVMRIERLLQEKVGTGVDTPKTAREVLIVNKEDSTEWRVLVDADIPNTITITKLDYVLDDTTNFHTAYTHSQDNTQAHTDYLLNTSDSHTGLLTIDSLAGSSNIIVLTDTLEGISLITVDSLNIGGENLIKMIKVGTHLALIFTGNDTMWAASDTTGF